MRPVLVPSIGEEADAIVRLDVADTGERAGIDAALRLIVDRGVDDCRVRRKDETDRDRARPAILGDGHEHRPACRVEERALSSGEGVFGRHRRVSSPNWPSAHPPYTRGDDEGALAGTRGDRPRDGDPCRDRRVPAGGRQRPRRRGRTVRIDPPNVRAPALRLHLPRRRPARPRRHRSSRPRR